MKMWINRVTSLNACLTLLNNCKTMVVESPNILGKSKCVTGKILISLMNGQKQ